MRAATWIHILPNRIKSHESFEILVWERGVSVGVGGVRTNIYSMFCMFYFKLDSWSAVQI